MLRTRPPAGHPHHHHHPCSNLGVQEESKVPRGLPCPGLHIFPRVRSNKTTFPSSLLEDSSDPLPRSICSLRGSLKSKHALEGALQVSSSGLF